MFFDSYMYTGFLALQMDIDRMILGFTQIITENTYVNFFPGSNCTCKVSILAGISDAFYHVMYLPYSRTQYFTPYSHKFQMILHEMIHRHSDQYHENVNTFTVKGDDYLLSVPNKGSDREFFQRSVICTTILVFSFASLIPSEQRRIVTEKEKGLKVFLSIV
ncbi:unnamed protein product [Orchesella dallaii]|uniref:Uncharacterized protein n=1 Tax=Orchesella dallaii TaxID=48710 RepID=A0ABP1RD21_9HEXA